MREFIVFESETMVESIVKDTYTFGLLMSCIYISRETVAWSIFCIVMLAIWLFGIAMRHRVTKFRDVDDLIKWAEQTHAVTPGSQP